VSINRAPTLWRHGILAAKPLLREGTNLQVNSLWEKGLNADYDGDVMQIHVPVTDEAIEDAKKMFPRR
jgi:DNA-directed RNA polymerase subunit beta'